MRRLLLALALLAVAAGAAGCAPSSRAAGRPPPGSAPPPATVDYSRPGPYRVGFLTIDAGGTTAVVVYPADPDSAAAQQKVTSVDPAAPMGAGIRAMVVSLVPEMAAATDVDASREPAINDEGPFPLVLSSHGLGADHLGNVRHLLHEASWGFVVVAPDHRSRNIAALSTNQVVVDADPDVNDLYAALAAIERENARVEGPLYGGVDTGSLLVEGAGAGARATYLFAAGQPDVRAWIGVAPAAPVPVDPSNPFLPDPYRAEDERVAALRSSLTSAPPLDRPVLTVQGERDGVVPRAETTALYEWLRPPKRLVLVRGAGYGSFGDVCVRLRARGGAAELAEQLPAFATVLKLAGDGCTPADGAPGDAQALLDHLAVAHLRYALGEDATAASLSDEHLHRRFPAAYASQQSAP